jgi:tRNA G10  N-methylase Trm11
MKVPSAKGRAPRWAELKIINPKRHADPAAVKEGRLFPYYAGFSSAFAESLLRSAELDPGATVIDPWNGAGTTTQAASRQGIASIGVDLNPVMVLVAKASLLSPNDASSLVPLAHAITESVPSQSRGISPDPLESWFIPKSASLIRQIEGEINRALVSHHGYAPLDNAESLADVSSIAAFFYVALFRTVRRQARGFAASNPTWTKKPDAANRLRPDRDTLIRAFLKEVESLASRIPSNAGFFQEDSKQAEIYLANAEALPLSAGEVDAAISSPPYCTRIDYAVATSVELAILRVGAAEFDSLRRLLTGTSTVEKDIEAVDPRWGACCAAFLQSVFDHESRASRTYYFKNHVQYFKSIYKSMGELGRVLAPGAPCVLVVQNSYYKEKMNDVAEIISEMGENAGLRLMRREDFPLSRSMVGMNSNAKKYLTRRTNVESVLCFERL